MDADTRDALQAKIDRHRRAWWWKLLLRNRCRACGWPTPCPARRRAQNALDMTRSAPPSWVELSTQPNPSIAPLMTYGQRFRSTGWWR